MNIKIENISTNCAYIFINAKYEVDFYRIMLLLLLLIEYIIIMGTIEHVNGKYHIAFQNRMKIFYQIAAKPQLLLYQTII